MEISSAQSGPERHTFVAKPVNGPTESQEQIVDIQLRVLIEYAKHLCGRFRLTVSDAGLMQGDPQSGFRRITDGRLDPTQAYYLGFKPPMANEVVDLTPRLAGVMQRDAQSFVEKIQFLAKMEEKPIPQGSGAVHLCEGRFYVRVNPVLESPEVAERFLGTLTRRGLLTGIAVAGAGLGIDGVRRITSTNQSTASQVVGGVETLAGLYFGSRLLFTGIRALSKPLLDRSPMTATDNSPERWDEFERVVSNQLGIGSAGSGRE